MKLDSKLITSERGSLNEYDFKDFDIQRIFIVSDVPAGSTRGYHAHEKTSQFLCCIEGSLEITLDNGNCRKTYVIEKSEYIFQNPLVWAEIKFLVSSSKLMTVCSTKHSEDDYIRDYQEFKKRVEC